MPDRLPTEAATDQASVEMLTKAATDGVQHAFARADAQGGSIFGLPEDNPVIAAAWKIFERITEKSGLAVTKSQEQGVKS